MSNEKERVITDKELIVNDTVQKQLRTQIPITNKQLRDVTNLEADDTNGQLQQNITVFSDVVDEALCKRIQKTGISILF